MTIVNNCDHLLYLGSQDQQTAQFIGCRAYKTPEAILCTPRDKAYLLTNGEKARLVEKMTPYSTVTEPEPDDTEDDLYTDYGDYGDSDWYDEDLPF